MSSTSESGDRILAILNLFTETRAVITADEMMETLGYSRPTLYRYLKTLKDHGYLTSTPRTGYMLGPRVTELDFLMTRADPLIAAGRPNLSRLADQHPGTAFLVRWYGGKLLCVASEVSVANARSSYPRGRPMPIGRGAISRAIAAHLPSRERRALVTDYVDEFAVAGVGGTVEEILDALAHVRRDGTAVAWGEVTSGVVAVAAPIFGPEQAPQGALCMTSEERGMTKARLRRIRTSVCDTARRITIALGGESDSAVA
jgi:DNA-binding IclR family transcriptional regulator